MNRPIPPLDPAPRAPFTRAAVSSLRGAYAEDDVRSFVEKLRHLATESPETCGDLFRGLDHILSVMLKVMRAGGSPPTSDNMRLMMKLARLGRPSIVRELERIVDNLAGKRGDW